MFVRLAGRVEVNAASLNAQGTAGNLIELTKVRVLRFDGGMPRLVEVPAVTGNTIKHWHFVHFVEAYKSLGGQNLCEFCKRGIGFRSPDRNKGSEQAFVEKCAGEDVHGFLQPERQVRRESLFKVSFLLPVEGMEAGFDTVTHNRVVVSEEGTIAGEAGMMLFKRQYSSSLYGFLMSLDLEYVGRLLYSPDHQKVIDNGERVRRGKAALLALLPLLAGDVGASRARALPAWRVRELLVAWSGKPIPQLMHGCYSDYVDASLSTLNEYSNLLNIDIEVLTFGIPEEKLKKASKPGESNEQSKRGGRVTIVRKDTWQEIVSHLVRRYEELGRS